jgi:hypothetical protein
MISGLKTITDIILELTTSLDLIAIARYGGTSTGKPLPVAI